MKCVVEISPSHYVSYMFVDLTGGNRRLNLSCMRTFAKKKGIFVFVYRYLRECALMDNGLLPHNLKKSQNIVSENRCSTLNQ